MLSRGRAFGGVVGSSKAVWAVQRAPAVLRRVIDLEHQRLVARLARKPEPLVLRIVGDRVGLADAVRVAPLRDDEVVERHAAGVGDGERMGLDRIADRPPHLDDGEAVLQQLFGLVGQDVAHALRAGPFRVVVVGAAHDLADFLLLAERIVGGAQRVVEHDDALGAALRFDQRLHLGIVDALHFGFVEEVLHPGVVRHEPEAVDIEIELADMRAAVVHHDLLRVLRAAGSDVERAWTAGVGEHLGTVVDEIVDDRLDGLRRGVEFGESGHDGLHSALEESRDSPAARQSQSRER